MFHNQKDFDFILIKRNFDYHHEFEKFNCSGCKIRELECYFLNCFKNSYLT